MTTENTLERLERWERLGENIEWWPHIPQWREEVRETFQLWERKDPEFMELWRETREWSLGEAWVFDDSIEHEAWNDADALRVILILDIWNPLLSEAERELITAMMAAKNAWTAAGG